MQDCRKHQSNHPVPIDKQKGSITDGWPTADWPDLIHRLQLTVPLNNNQRHVIGYREK